jgi:hypothetical protein
LDVLDEEGGLDGDGAWEAARLIDLTKIEWREDDRLLLLSSQASDGMPGEIIGAQGQMSAVALNYAHGDDAYPYLTNGCGEFIGG